MNKYLLAFCFVFLAAFGFAQEDDELDKDVPQEQTDTIDIDDIEIEDIDFEEVEEDELSKESTFPWHKFAVGGQLGSLQFGDITNYAIMPEMVYNINDTFAVGVDGILDVYKAKRVYYNGFTYDADYSDTNTGGRVFTRVKPVQSFPIFAQVEYERLTTNTPYARDPNSNTFNYLDVKQDLDNIGAGLGFNNGPYYMALMYNFMNSKNKDDYRELAANDYKQATGVSVDPNRVSDDNYTNALMFRGGILIPLGQGNKNRKRK